MLPRLVLRVRKVVRRIADPAGDGSDLSGAENRARWQAMISGLHERDRAAERRLAEAERALNRLNRN